MMNNFWKLIEAYKIPTLPSVNVSTTDEARVVAQQEIGYPLVCKIWSDNISHKSDVGGVVINIRDRPQLSKVMDDMVDNIMDELPGVIIKGFTLQKQAPENGLEMIVGIKKDNQFGHVILFGLGGIYAELFKDVSFKVVPFHRETAYQMIIEINSFKILQGFRGKPAIDLINIIDVIMKLQDIVMFNPDIEELDINPLICYENEVIAVDGRVF